MGKIKKIKDWFNDHEDTIATVGLSIFGVGMFAAGYILGRDTVISAAKEKINDVIGNVVGTTGYCMADMATRLVEETPNLYELIKTDHDSAVEFICKKFDEFTASHIFNGYTGGKA